MLNFIAALIVSVLNAPDAEILPVFDVDDVIAEEREAVRALKKNASFAFDESGHVVTIVFGGGSKLDDRTVQSLRALSKLRDLEIMRCELPDACLKLLYDERPRLEKIAIRQTHVTRQGIGELRKRLLDSEIEWFLPR
jgi:hypothetical protein